MQVKYTSRSGSSLTRGKPIEQVEENILLLLVGADWSLLTAEVTTKVSSRPPGDPQRQISTMFSKADTRLRHLLSHRACVFKLSRPTRTPRPCPMAGIDCAAGLRRHLAGWRHRVASGDFLNMGTRSLCPLNTKKHRCIWIMWI